MRVWITIALVVGCQHRRAAPPPPPSPPPPSPAVAPTRSPAVVPDASPTVATPAPPGPRVAKIFGGPRQLCRILGGGKLQCWGLNQSGELGDGTVQNRATPTDVAIDDAIDVALGDSFSCALRKAGTVACWGKNADGQLGDGTLAAHAAPAAVSQLAGATSIAAGNSHACALLGDGGVMCWGANDHGQLGDGTTVPHALPTRVRGLAKVDQLVVGGDHACARVGDRVWCWGANEMGELGLAGRSIHAPAKSPIQLPALAGVVELAAGLNHTCARHTDGTVSCWGWDEECQSGARSDETCLSGSPCVRVPRLVPGLGSVVELAPSAMHSCARLADGTVSCWGDNPAEFKADNTTDPTVQRLCTPTRVTSIHDAVQLTTFWGGVCVLREAGSIDCWGSNWFGELGDGTTTGRPTPAPVH